MSAFTLTQLLARVRRKGNYPNTGNNPASPISDTFLTEEINGGIADYETLLDQRWEGYRDKTTPTSGMGEVVTVASVATVALPTDFLRLQAADILWSGVYRPLRRLTIARAYPYQLTTDIPDGYMLVGSSFELFPTPNGVYRLRLRYMPVTTVLVTGADSITIPNGWERYIVELALLAADQQQQRSIQDRATVLARLEAAIIAAAGDRNVAEPEQIPFPGESDGFFWYLP